MSPFKIVEYPNTIIKNYAEAVARTFSVKKVFLKVSHNSQGNTCVGVSFEIKLLASGLSFPVNFAKSLRTPFIIEHSSVLFTLSHTTNLSKYMLL